MFRPIWKAGPKIIRKACNLRLVSFGSDMAQVQDALWMNRSAQLIETCVGPDQVGGELDAVSLVLAIVLLCQARQHQGLATILAILDLKWAFDLASIDGMLPGCYSAGIWYWDWLLIDDILRSDQQVLELHGILSTIFALGCGTAQGRKFSLHVFNGLLKTLADELGKPCRHQRYSPIFFL